MFQLYYLHVLTNLVKGFFVYNILSLNINLYYLNKNITPLLIKREVEIQLNV